MAAPIELGLDTFGDVTVDERGERLSAAQVIRNVVEQGVLADRVGVDFLGVGEHHRDDFAVSTPETVLAAIAARTERIRLGSAVTVLSSDDPVRVFQRFSTVDAISSGRAEVILGRGSFTESFPLFGYALSDYEVLFEEKLELFSELLKGGATTWQGTTRGALKEQHVHPEIEGDGLVAWVGVGGSPESVVRTAKYGFRLMLAVIGGEPSRFAPYVGLYQRALEQFGRGPLPIGVHSPGHIADTDAEAIEQYWPHYEAMHSRIGRERGWGPASREQFEQEVRSGSQYVGSPETVARKIASTVQALSLSRFDLKYGSGPLPHELQLRTIELYGTTVIPMVRELLGE